MFGVCLFEDLFWNFKEAWAGNLVSREDLKRHLSTVWKLFTDRQLVSWFLAHISSNVRLQIISYWKFTWVGDAHVQSGGFFFSRLLISSCVSVCGYLTLLVKSRNQSSWGTQPIHTHIEHAQRLLCVLVFLQDKTGFIKSTEIYLEREDEINTAVVCLGRMRIGNCCYLQNTESQSQNHDTRYFYMDTSISLDWLDWKECLIEII